MKIPKPLIVSLILFAAGQIVPLAMPWTHVWVENSTQRFMYQAMLSNTAAILFLLASAIWAFFAARKEKSSPVFWVLLTFFTGLNGLVLFYAYHFFQKTKTSPETSQES